MELQDAYKSIDESLLQAAIYNHHKLDLHLFHSEKLNNENAAEQLKDMDGILIAPGFGQRGIEGKFAAIKYAREHDVPCLGICLGMQCMVIEFARDVLGLADDIIGRPVHQHTRKKQQSTYYKVRGGEPIGLVHRCGGKVENPFSLHISIQQIEKDSH